MAQYHYSAQFEQSAQKYHGEFETLFRDKETLISIARNKLADKMPDWSRTPEQLTEFQLYTYPSWAEMAAGQENEERIVFEWRK